MTTVPTLCNLLAQLLLNISQTLYIIDVINTLKIYLWQCFCCFWKILQIICHLSHRGYERFKPTLSYTMNIERDLTQIMINLPTRFKFLNNQKLGAIYVICRSPYINKCMPNFNLQVFKIMEVYVIVFSISFLLRHFSPKAAAKFRQVWKISDLSIKISHKLYATYFLIL